MFQSVTKQSGVILAIIIMLTDYVKYEVPKSKNAMTFANAPNAITFRLPNFSRIKPRINPPGIEQSDDTLTKKAEIFYTFSLVSLLFYLL